MLQLLNVKVNITDGEYKKRINVNNFGNSVLSLYWKLHQKSFRWIFTSKILS